MSGQQVNDSYQATGDDGGQIGFLNLSKKHPKGTIRGAPTGAVLYASKTGLKAMVGETDASSTLLDAQAGEGYGIGGASNISDGVIGVSSSDTSEAKFPHTPSGVFGIHTGKGDGVYGHGVNGVIGKTFDKVGSGVLGFNASSGPGVTGNSNTGYGGQFMGQFAQLYLVPSPIQGPPSSGNHQQGEFFVDNQGVLFYCKASGNPGTWKTVVLA